MGQAAQRFTAVLSNMIHQTSQYTTYKHMRASASESDREPWQTALLIFISFQVWIKHLIMFVPNFKLRHFTPDTLRGCAYMSMIVRDRKVKQCLKGCQLSLSKFDFLITYTHKIKQTRESLAHKYTPIHACT